MSNIANEPAFPIVVDDKNNGSHFSQGLSKRELIAAIQMAGLNAATYSDSEGNAREAVRQADALLIELSKP